MELKDIKKRLKKAFEKTGIIAYKVSTREIVMEDAAKAGVPLEAE